MRKIRIPIYIDVHKSCYCFFMSSNLELTGHKMSMDDQDLTVRNPLLWRGSVSTLYRCSKQIFYQHSAYFNFLQYLKLT